MSERKRYRVLVGQTAAELEEDVNDAIAEGYEPCGGVNRVIHQWENERKGYTETAHYFAQAVWLPEPADG